MHSEQFGRSGQSRLYGQERIVQVDQVHPSSPARALEKLCSTGVSSVELLLPSFQLATSSREGFLGPHAVFSSRLVIALILVTHVLG